MILKRMGKGKRYANREPHAVPTDGQIDWDIYEYGMRHFDYVAARKGYLPTAGAWYDIMRSHVSEQLVKAARNYDPERGGKKNWAINSVALAMAHGVTHLRLQGFSGRDDMRPHSMQREERAADEQAVAPDCTTDAIEALAKIEAFLAKAFSNRERLFFWWYFRDGLTCTQIAQLYATEHEAPEITRQRVQQIIATVTERVQEMFAYMEYTL